MLNRNRCLCEFHNVTLNKKASEKLKSSVALGQCFQTVGCSVDVLLGQWSNTGTSAEAKVNKNHFTVVLSGLIVKSERKG